ncbi:MAG: 23S rRNA (adenine(2503)-C(2))-methyltransferase RlmN [Candidatus Omnitrophica bacterium]|nr:23S rRNA (adenine(2503)-C(2))-methyltransferase RlmN [Candidatus Omnitrophota bacterium]
MRDIKELDFKELESVLKSWGMPAFHARQVFRWIYQKGADDFGCMTNLALTLRKKLQDDFYILGISVIKALCSKDGTEKFLFELKDKNLIEAVSIPAEGRITACLSSQAGCKFSCRFCASGMFGFKRNLTCAEILEELHYLKAGSQNKRITHVVFMGTGEPLDNYDNVLKAVRMINSKDGFNIASRRITISTNGVIPGIKRLAQEGLQIELSVSLHAADDKTRFRIMPINRIYPLKELMRACRAYVRKTNRQITFEYILIKGINSDLPNAQKLSTILKGLNCKVNLIPCNPIEGLNIVPPGEDETRSFKGHLIRSGVHVTLRRSRGQDIEAACGQLRSRYVKK